MTEHRDVRGEPLAMVSREAEHALLGGLLLDNSAIDRIPELEPAHFCCPEHRLIFSALRRELALGRPVDVVSAFEALDRAGKAEECGGLTYLNALAQSVPSAANLRRYAEIVRERYQARRLHAACLAAAEAVQDETLPIGERFDMVMTELGKLNDQAAQAEAIGLHEALIQHTEILEARASGDIRAFATGFPRLDDALVGGLRPGELTIVAARPGMGKTAAGLNIALHVAREHPTLMLNLEMSKSQLLDRLTAQLGNIEMPGLQRPDAADDGLWSRVSDAVERASTRRLYLDCEGGLTLRTVSAKARAARRKHGLHLLILDYLQLMPGADPRMPRAYQLAEITGGLKSLAKELDICIVALAQVNRQVLGMPGLGDLKDSGAIEQDADVVVFLHRPILDDPDLGEEWRHFAKWRVAKNRQGPAGVDLPMSYEGSRTRFTTWSGPEPVKPVRRSGGVNL